MTTTLSVRESPGQRETWERERLLESLEAYRRGLADGPTV